MDELNYLHLYYFWIASQERGFLKASRKIGISQSTISTQIQNLEKRLECRLVRRGPRTFELTREGQTAFAYCETIFQNGENLVRSLRKEALRGARLRVGFEFHASKDLQAKFLQSLMDIEGISFRAEHGSADELIRKVTGRQLDVALCNTRPSQNDDRSLKSKVLTSSSVVLAGKRKWWRKKERGFPEMGAIPFFLPPSGSVARASFDLWIRQMKASPVEARLETPDESLRKRMAVDGHGIALLTKSCIADDIKAERLQTFHEFRGHEQNVFLIYLSELEKNPALQKSLQKMRL